ncbi:MAG TPA: hypothetical protein VI454_01745 [Verrucomicrobiae bacterium]
MISVVTLAACGALWYLVIRAQHATIKERAAKFEETHREVEYSERLVKQAVKIEADLDRATERLQQIEDTMAQGDMYSWIIKTMNKFAANYRVDIPTYTPPGVGEVGILPQFPYKAATYAIRGTGYFHEFGRFLADFENQFPCARVQNLDLEPIGILAAKPEDAEKISFKMEIVTLIKPNAAL